MLVHHACHAMLMLWQLYVWIGKPSHSSKGFEHGCMRDRRKACLVTWPCQVSQPPAVECGPWPPSCLQGSHMDHGLACQHRPWIAWERWLRPAQAASFWQGGWLGWGLLQELLRKLELVGHQHLQSCQAELPAVCEGWRLQDEGRSSPRPLVPEPQQH